MTHSCIHACTERRPGIRAFTHCHANAPDIRSNAIRGRACWPVSPWRGARRDGRSALSRSPVGRLSDRWPVAHRPIRHRSIHSRSAHSPMAGRPERPLGRRPPWGWRQCCPMRQRAPQGAAVGPLAGCCALAPRGSALAVGTASMCPLACMFDTHTHTVVFARTRSYVPLERGPSGPPLSGVGP